MGVKDITYQHLIVFQGTDGKINDTVCRFLVTEYSDSNTDGADLKNIVTNEPLKQGDYLTIDDSIYMVIDIKKVINSSYTVGIFRKCISETILLGSTLKPVYAVVDKLRGVYAQGTEITEVHDQYSFIISKSSDSNMSSLNVGTNLIIYAGGSYDIISVDDSKDGILVITGKFNSIYVPVTYNISLSSSAETVVATANYQIVTTCTADLGAVENPTIVYSSSDSTIATVDANGLVVGISVGTCNIIANYQGVEAILSLIVEAKPVIPVVAYASSWSSGTSLKYACSSTCTMTKKIDNVLDSSLIVNYSFDTLGASLISSGVITITKKTNASYQIKNVSNSTIRTITVTFTDASTGATILVQPIELRYMS